MKMNASKSTYANRLTANATPPSKELPCVIMYTDGACSGNPGPGGWGVVMLYKNHQKTFSGHQAYATSNQMELLAPIMGLEQLKTRCHVKIFTDSKYVYDGITSWIKSWLNNNWRKNDNTAVKNCELWHRLYTLAQKHVVEWAWVKAHDSCRLNNLADSLAVDARIQAQKDLLHIKRQPNDEDNAICGTRSCGK